MTKRILIVCNDNPLVLSGLYKYISANNPSVEMEYFLCVRGSTSKRTLFKNHFKEGLSRLRVRRFKSRLKSSLGTNYSEIDGINTDLYHNILNTYCPDVAIYVLFNQIVPKSILLKSRINLNVHNAHLPEFRGCRPIKHLIKQKISSSLLTLHLMDEGIDTGNIIFELPYRLSSGININHAMQKSVENLDLLLKYGLRRCLKFDGFVGIEQDTYRGVTNYYRR